MVFQEDKTGSGGSFCFEQNRRRRRSVLPWKTSSAAKGYSHPLTFLKNDEVKPVSEPELSFTPDRLAQAFSPLSPAELHALYAGTSVPQHRYLAPALLAAVHSPEIALDPAKWFAGLEDIQLFSLVDAWLHTNNNSSFEQLKAVSLDPHTSQLTAVLAIKQSCGYLGGPSTAGSREYVAFWVDWGFGFQYEGTASAAVFDSTSLAAPELEITVSLPADLSRHAQAECLAAPAIKVRAVLSWNTPPSTTHPNTQVVWGNSLESRIVTVSHPEMYTGKWAKNLSDSRRPDSSFSLRVENLTDRGLSFTRFYANSIDWVRNTTSC